MPTTKPIISLAIDETLLERLDDFRYENRFPSRSAAILYLIRKALDTIDAEKKPCN